jgi:hypothetical protein
MGKYFSSDLSVLSTDELWKKLHQTFDRCAVTGIVLFSCFPIIIVWPKVAYLVTPPAIFLLVFIQGKHKRLVAEIHKRYEGDGKPIDCPDKRE